MKIAKTIKINTYYCSVMFVITTNLKKTEIELYKKYNNGVIPEYEGDAEGFTISMSGTLYIVALDHKFLNHNLIGHELYHATHRIAEDRDISDEESRAWICGFLNEEFYKFFSSSKVQSMMDKLNEDKTNGNKPGTRSTGEKSDTESEQC